MKKYDQATELFEHAVELEAMGEVEMAIGHLEQAANLLDPTEHFPEYADVVNVLAELLSFDTVDDRRAVNWLRRALKVVEDPSMTEAFKDEEFAFSALETYVNYSAMGRTSLDIEGDALLEVLDRAELFLERTGFWVWKDAVLEERAQLLALRGDESALAMILTAIELAESHDYTSPGHDYHGKQLILMEILFQLQRLEEAIDVGLALVDAEPPLDILLTTFARLVPMFLQVGEEPEKVRAVSSRAVEHAREAEALELAHLLGVHFDVLEACGAIEETMAVGEELLALANDHGDLDELRIAYHCLAAAHLHRGKVDVAWSYFEKTEALARQFDELMGTSLMDEVIAPLRARFVS